MIPVEEDVFQRVSWNSADPNNTDTTDNRNVYFKSLKRIGNIFKIKNTVSERNKSSRSWSSKPAWEGGKLPELSKTEKSRAGSQQRNTTLNIIQRTEQVKMLLDGKTF